MAQEASTEETDGLGPLSKYKDAFVRSYQQYFTQFSTEEQRVEAATQLFNTVKTPSELAKIALTLKLIQPIVQTVDSNNEEVTTSATQLQRNESLSTDMREKPAQNKLTREIDVINHRIQKLYELRKLRELNSIEQNEVRDALIEREELRKRLKKTQDAAIRAKRYRIRKATLMSTDSDFGSLDTAEPALKFSRSHSTNVLMTSDEDPQILNKSKDQLTVRTSGLSIDGISRENSVCLTVTPTPELSKLNISPALSFSSIKLENISPAPPENESQSIILDCRPSSQQNRTSTTEEENNSPPIESANLQCQQCSALFSSLNDFIEHMRTTHLNNHNNTDFQCRICDRVFQNQQDKLVHLMEHYIKTRADYTCTKCSKEYTNATAFRQHFASAHTEILFRCNLCLQIFTDNSIFQEHIISHSIQETTFECTTCNFEFDSQEKFATHVQLVHERFEDTYPTSILQSTISRKLVNNSSFEESTKNLKCFVCDAKFTDELELDSHRLLRHCKVPKGDKCAVCRKTLNLEQFFLHTKEHYGDLEISCVICRQSIRNEKILKLHGEFHLTDETIQQTTCQICSKSISLDSLAEHILQHTFESTSTDLDTSTNGNSFVCDCGEKFESLSELQFHSLTHLTTLDTELKLGSQNKEVTALSSVQGQSSVNRKFSCNQCRQSFNTLNRLQSHKKRHLGQKLICQICDLKFNTMDLLTNHLRVHELKLHSSSNNHSPVGSIEI